MYSSRLASRYAKTFFELAKEHGVLDKVYADTQYIQAVAVTPDFRTFLRNPIIGVSKKKEVFQALFGHKIQPITLKALQAVLEHKRERYLSDISLSFKALYHKEKGISTVKIISAVELSAKAEQAILQEFKTAGIIQNQVELETSVDAKIIGGFILEADGQVYDASLANKLARLKSKFTENLYVKNL